MRTCILYFFIATISVFALACKDKARTVEVDQPEETAQTQPSAPAPTSSSQPDQPSTPPQKSDPVPDSLAFKIQRTACFGACPSYELTIYESGFVTYEGRSHVERIGKHTVQVPPGTLEKLVKEAEAKGFFEMKPEYDRPVTDLPSTIITVRKNGDTKQVKGRVDIPQAFKDLVAYAEEILFALPWKPVAEHHDH
jgi:hypothetical protein